MPDSRGVHSLLSLSYIMRCISAASSPTRVGLTTQRVLPSPVQLYGFPSGWVRHRRASARRVRRAVLAAPALRWTRSCSLECEGALVPWTTVRTAERPAGETRLRPQG